MMDEKEIKLPFCFFLGAGLETGPTVENTESNQRHFQEVNGLRKKIPVRGWKRGKGIAWKGRERGPEPKRNPRPKPKNTMG